MTHNRSWIVQYNPAEYEVLKSFREQGFIYWSQNQYKYKVGDILYLYASSPVQIIDCVAKVVETDVVYNASLDHDADYANKENRANDDGQICIKIVPIAYNTGRHPNYQDLRAMGIRGFQGPCTLKPEQIQEIEKQLEIIYVLTDFGRWSHACRKTLPPSAR